MTVAPTVPDTSAETRQELRLLSAVQGQASGYLAIRRVVNHGQHQTLGAAGLLVPRDIAEAYERLATLATPLVVLDKEQIISATGRIETARVALTDAGRVRLQVLRQQAS